MQLPAPVGFDQWVNDNNPASNLSYGKGWWDYIEILRRLASKFEVENVTVVGTYLMKTPPPTEELCMPVIRLRKGETQVLLCWEFSRLEQSWGVSIRTAHPVELPGAVTRLLTKMPAKPLLGMHHEWHFRLYAENPMQFSCALDDELDVATLLRLCIA